MSNAVGARSSREEEIAFLAMEQVLKVDIRLADAGAGNKMPDGSWVRSGGRGIVEVTSPPASALMAEWAAAKRAGRPQTEGGSIPLRLNELSEVCMEMLSTDWAVENIEKLQAQQADERHLFLFARSYETGNYFDRLSDSYEDGATESVDDLTLPQGISDVWFRGRAWREPDQPLGSTEIRLARFSSESGWHTYVVSVEERFLPAPAPGIADDHVPSEWRRTKDRTPDLARE